MAGLLMGGGNTTVGTKYNSMGLQSSQQGLPVPIIYGTVKTSANLIWYGDFTAHENVEGGKGGTTITSYTYTCAVALGIAEGEVLSFGTVWLADGKTTLSDLGLSAFYGAADQTAWSYLTTKHTTEALNYRSTAYLAASTFDLGQTNTLPQLWFEVSGFLNGTGTSAGTADAAQVIYDFLTDTRYGCRLPVAYMDTESIFTNSGSYQQYCGVNGISFAVNINENKAARDYITSWLEATNSAAVWNADKLKIIPFGDKSMHRGDYTYTPNLTICAELTDDDFLYSDGEEPIQITRADAYDCYNNVKVLVRDSDNEYNTATCEVKDQASIEKIGLRTRSQVSAEFISSPTAGMMAAELIKNRGLYIRNNFRFRLSWEYALLEPMDLISLTSPGLGLSAKPVRIMEITEDDLGLLEILAEDFIEGSQWSVQYPPQSGSGYISDSQMAPGDVNAPIIFEPLADLIGTANPQVWAVVTGTPGTWGGARVWLSTDGGDNYSAIGTVDSGGITGELTTSLSPSGTTLSVDLSECGGTLSSVSAGDAALGRTAMLIGPEILAYTTATLTGTNRYDLTGLVRGLYCTVAGSHSASDRIGYLGGPAFKFVIPNQSYYGVTVSLKFTSYNIYGSAIQGLDAAAEYTYTITGAGSVRNGYIQASQSGLPAAGAVIATYITPSGMTIPGDLAGSVATIGTNPTATAVFSMKKNGSNFATASVSAGGVVTFTGAETTFAATDVLTITAPSPQDITLANCAFMIKFAG